MSFSFYLSGTFYLQYGENLTEFPLRKTAAILSLYLLVVVLVV
uniref:Uncharacterized protein n=1 Tax=Rhizophora mucronata TaxID=61149 RepID=A0A2P2PQX5_RHIMU